MMPPPSTPTPTPVVVPPVQPPARPPSVPVQPAASVPASTPVEPPARLPGAAEQPPVRRPDAAIAAGSPAIAARTPADADQPASRLPTATVAARPKPVASVERRVAQPGDRICGSCGEPNDPTRKFCRRCGNGLATAQIVSEKPLPWWRRIFRRQPKTPKQYAAGERVSSMKPGSPGGGVGAGIRGLFKLRNLAVAGLGIVVAIGIFGYIGIPSFQKYVSEATSGGIPGIVERIQHFINPPLTIVHPDPNAVTASNDTSGHEARKAFDGFVNTDWQGTGATPSLTVKFKEPIDLGAVIFHIGNQDAFVDMRRPATVELDYSDGTSATFTLQDVHDGQTFDLGASAVDSVTIKVTSTNGPDGTPVSISEIELFRKG